MAAVSQFGAQIAAQTRDIFLIWKIVPICNIYHYHKTNLEYNLGKFFWTNKNCLGPCLKTEVNLNHCSNDWDHQSDLGDWDDWDRQGDLNGWDHTADWGD